MKPRVLTTLMVCSTILTTTVTPAVAAVTTQPGAPTTTQPVQPAPAATDVNPAASAFMDLQLQNGQLVDVKGHTQWQKVGQPTTVQDQEQDGAVLGLDGRSAFYTTFFRCAV
ncbi:hypothetical protein [Lactiplantibacillus modestisalitolerans]|uniref:Cell surface protein n=1 Tax=Lactiplantibacillus modestisalitolerans TaxID=1457219 RepID=A0ABV5WS05_9LACO|nr:hypothetical protein [Lactiplantibacillus modestisalitolerans]